MNMSFSKKTEQVRARTATVTRRFGWWSLKPGTKLWAIEKGQGLKKGEKVVRICMIEIVSVREELVGDIRYQPEELALEGFPDMTAQEFIHMLCCGQGKDETSPVNRIKFKYL